MASVLHNLVLSDSGDICNSLLCIRNSVLCLADLLSGTRAICLARLLLRLR
jgi:hypothetical protein